MATDAELLAEAKKIDALNKRKRPNPSRRRKGKGKQAAKRSTPSVAKCAPRKNEHKNVTIVLPHGAHLAMVGSTFEVRGGKKVGPAKRKAGAKSAKKRPTTKRKRKKAKSNE